jgi:predicted dinucleotide-binding enzyme
MLIAIIGAGNVGAALGEGWSRAGHGIRFGVTDPTDARHGVAAAKAGNAFVGSAAQAAEGAGAVVLAVPWDAVAAAVEGCGDLQGRIVIDVTNPLRAGPSGPELALGFDRSGGEVVAGFAPGASVFKTMNQVGYQVMAHASGYPTAPAMFVAGDDAERKPEVISLVEDLGFAAVDAGPLSVARLLEPYAMLWIHMAVNQGAPLRSAFAFMERDSAG